jgi:myo-inositol-1(or 4)-monophosphatase
MLNIATRAARKAGDIIARSADQVDRLTIRSKSENDYVSEVDDRAEQAIIDTILKAYPDHGILAEESGDHAGDDTGYQWIIDPLDGTTNFLHGIPQYAVSIALRHRGRLDQAVIYDPIKQELYTASRGQGAQLNGKRIRVSNRPSLKGALLGTGIPFKNVDTLDKHLKMMRALIPGTAGIRRAGSAALDLAYVAAGRLDAFWEFDLNAWDMAAGVLLIEEAGGLVGDFQGGFDHLSSGNIIAANPKLFKLVLQGIRPLA